MVQMSPKHPSLSETPAFCANSTVASTMRAVILVDKQRFNDDKNFVDVGTNEVVELVEYSVNDFDE